MQLKKALIGLVAIGGAAALVFGGTAATTGWNDSTSGTFSESAGTIDLSGQPDFTFNNVVPLNDLEATCTDQTNWTGWYSSGVKTITNDSSVTTRASLELDHFGQAGIPTGVIGQDFVELMNNLHIGWNIENGTSTGTKALGDLIHKAIANSGTIVIPITGTQPANDDIHVTLYACMDGDTPESLMGMTGSFDWTLTLQSVNPNE